MNCPLPVLRRLHSAASTAEAACSPFTGSAWLPPDRIG